MKKTNKKQSHINWQLWADLSGMNFVCFGFLVVGLDPDYLRQVKQLDESMIDVLFLGTNISECKERQDLPPLLKTIFSTDIDQVLALLVNNLGLSKSRYDTISDARRGLSAEIEIERLLLVFSNSRLLQAKACDEFLKFFVEDRNRSGKKSRDRMSPERRVRGYFHDFAAAYVSYEISKSGTNRSTSDFVREFAESNACKDIISFVYEIEKEDSKFLEVVDTVIEAIKKSPVLKRT